MRVPPGIADLNDEMLAAAGSAWDDWQPFDHRPTRARGFRARARAALRDEFGDSRLFVLADPRLCRLLDFWVRAVTNFGAHPVVVAPVRNPLDVAASLETLDGRDPSIAHVPQLLWLRYVPTREQASRPLTRAFLRYEELVENPHAVVAGWVTNSAWRGRDGRPTRGRDRNRRARDAGAATPRAPRR